jgi:hypothetical protein
LRPTGDVYVWIGKAVMKTLTQSHSGGPGFFTVRRAKLLWCEQFHQKWRRRVAIFSIEASGLGYKVHCLKCGLRDIEITEFQKTEASG